MSSKDDYIEAIDAAQQGVRDIETELEEARTILRDLEVDFAKHFKGGIMSERDDLAQVIYDVLDPQYGDFNMPDDAADAVLASGYRKQRVITSVKALKALPDGSVVVDGDGDPWTKFDRNKWLYGPLSTTPAMLIFSYEKVRVVWEPQS